MVAVVNHLHFTIPIDDLRTIVQEDGVPLISKLPGFRDFFFVKVDSTHAIVIIFWKDAESADAGAKIMGPNWFVKHFKPFLARPEDRSVGEIIAAYKPELRLDP
ncbi:MAG TPA: hypothetical protein VMH23_19830 [Bacteroidota bacterium]|nr:hypothetical protein [Bacteroidota bacterium]